MPRKSPSQGSQQIIPVEAIERRIFLIRGQKVMLDSDLAQLYQVPTKSLNLAVRRNAEWFPADFMFQLTGEESASLRFQIETSKKRRGGRPYLPYAFTEHGVATVLRSQRPVQVDILIMSAFVRLREMLATHKDLARKLEELERKYDARFKVVFEAIRKLMEPAPSPETPDWFQPQRAMNKSRARSERSLRQNLDDFAVTTSLRPC